MVLIKLRHTNEIKAVDIKEANQLIRTHKAYLYKATNTIEIFVEKSVNGFKQGFNQVELNIAQSLEKSEKCIITEWLCDKEKRKLKVKAKENSKKEIINE